MAEPRKALRGRVIRQKIARSRQVCDLIETRTAWAGLIFERLIVFADDAGRFVAEPAVVKGQTIPYHKRSERSVRADLEAMEELGLIRLYSVNGTLYGHFPTWSENQPVVRLDRFFPSEIPEPPQIDSQSDGQIDSHTDTQSDGRDSDTDSDTDTDTDTEGSRRRQKKPPTTPHPVVVHHVHDTLAAKLGCDPRQPWAAVGKWVKDTLKTRTAEEINAVWDHWLASEDVWAKQHAWSWNQFVSNFNGVELALREKRPYGHIVRPRASEDRPADSARRLGAMDSGEEVAPEEAAELLEQAKRKLGGNSE